MKYSAKWVLRFVVNSFVAFSISKAVFLILNVEHLENKGFLTFVKLLYHALPLDLSTLSYAISLLFLILFFIPSRSALKVYEWFEISFFTLLFGLNLIDSALFDAWGTRINLQAFFYLNNIKGALASLSFLNVVSFFSLLSLQVLCIFVFSKYTKKYYCLTSSFTDENKSKRILFFLLMSPLLFLFIRGGVGKVPINQSRVVYSQSLLLNTCAVNPVWNALYYLFSKNSVLDFSMYQNVSNEELSQFEADFKDKGLISSPAFFKGKPNILLLVMESLSAETLLKANGELNWSSGLNNWFDSSFVFTHMIASGNRTDKGVVAILSGFPSMSTVSVMTEPSRSSKLPSVACELVKQGYSTGFYYGGDLAFANMGYYLSATCFQKLVDQNHPSHLAALRGNWGYHDASLFSILKSSVLQTNAPFFITGLSLSVHEPYDIPGRKATMEQAFRYSDSCLADFLTYLRQTSVWQNTLVVITGDHGRDLDLSNKHYHDPYKFRIPFVLTGGALSEEYKGKVSKDVISQTDGMPFVLHELGFDVSPFSFYKYPFSRSSNAAAYFFDNGFGVLNDSQSLLFYNDTKRIDILYGEEGTYGTAHILTYGKSLQQSVVKKYLSLLPN